MRRPRLVTFDIFGTLFRIEEARSMAVMQSIIEKHDLDLTPDELTRMWWDKSYKVAHDGFCTVREATARALQLLFEEAQIEDDTSEYTHSLLKGWAMSEPYPEVPQALRELEEFTLGIVSNIDDDLLDELLRNSGISERFEVRVTSESAGVYKPDPVVFKMALREAECKAEDALHLGDSPVDDILGPKRVGMMAGWVNRRGETIRGRIPQPDLVVKDLEEAARAILRA